MVSRKVKRVALGIGCTVAALVLLSLFVLWLLIKLPFLAPEPWSIRKARFGWAATRNERLIAAINRYQSDHSTPPGSLEALVPKYFTKVPKTGLLDNPNFIYTRFTNSYHLFWYDLGSRGGRPVTGLWCYPDGDPEHAILALTVEKGGRVVEARVDREPEGHGRIPFDEARWKRKEARIEMVRALPDHLRLPGVSSNEVARILGFPDGSRSMIDTPWELKVKCPSWWGLDVFFYWPTEKYPKYIYGGETELIGKWAYVHE